MLGMKQYEVSQVTRDNNGTLEYGWRPESDTEGDPSEVVWTTDANAPSGYKAWSMTSANYATSRPAGYGQWGVCPVCGESFPLSEMIEVNGRMYSIKNGCAEEKQHDA